MSIENPSWSHVLKNLFIKGCGLTVAFGLGLTIWIQTDWNQFLGSEDRSIRAINDLEVQIAKKEAEIDGMRTEGDSLKNSLDNSLEERSRMKVLVDTLASENQELKNSLSDQDDELSVLSGKLKDASKTVSQLMDENQLLKKENELFEYALRDMVELPRSLFWKYRKPEYRNNDSSTETSWKRLFEPKYGIPCSDSHPQ